MIVIRDLTPRVKREIVMDEAVGRQSFGTVRMREATGRLKTVRTPADPREPNIVGPWELTPDNLKSPYRQDRPFDILRSSPIPAPAPRTYREPGKALGARVYDPAIDAYVRVPPRPMPEQKVPGDSVTPYSDTEGGFYWITCSETGFKMRRIRAQTAARAAQFAAEYAKNHGLAASDAYAVEL